MYAWRQLARRATAASSREPTLRLLQGRRDPAFRSPRTAPPPGEPAPPTVSVSLQPVPSTIRVCLSVGAPAPPADPIAACANLPADKRGNFTLVTETMKVCSCDGVVTHPCTADALKRGAAVQDGWAAAKCKHARRKAYCNLTAGYDFVPLAHETYGRLGRPAAALVDELAGLAATSREVSKSAFVVAAYQELSMAAVQGNALCFAHLVFNWARAAGWSFWPGNARPSCAG